MERKIKRITNDDPVIQELLRQFDQTEEDHPLIYKYASPDSCIKILISSKLAFSNPSLFNDPFECYDKLMSYENIPDDVLDYAIDVMPNFTDQQRKASKELHRLHPTSKEDLIKAFIRSAANAKASIGISCFSAEPYQLLMWSHYGNSHEGFCIEFDTSLLLRSLEQAYSISISKVEYKDEFIPIDYFDHQIKATNSWIGTKSYEWAYEKELRLVSANLLKNGNTRDFLEFNPQCIKSIFIGLRAKPAEIELVEKVCKAQYPHVKLFKMETESHSFRLRATEN